MRVTIALDVFETGYSSLDYFRRLAAEGMENAEVEQKLIDLDGDLA